MIIFTQDKKNLVKCDKISVEKNFGGGKDAKYMLVGMGGFNIGATTLGAYPEENNAMDELNKINAAFAGGANTYEIK